MTTYTCTGTYSLPQQYFLKAELQSHSRKRHRATTSGDGRREEGVGMQKGFNAFMFKTCLDPSDLNIFSQKKPSEGNLEERNLGVPVPLQGVSLNPRLFAFAYVAHKLQRNPV